MRTRLISGNPCCELFKSCVFIGNRIPPEESIDFSRAGSIVGPESRENPGSICTAGGQCFGTIDPAVQAGYMGQTRGFKRQLGFTLQENWNPLFPAGGDLIFRTCSGADQIDAVILTFPCLPSISCRGWRARPA